VTKSILGTLTIGQAPRPDITPILDRYLPATVRCIHAGVLDGLSREEIGARYAPRPGEAVLVTRLHDGSAVLLGKPAVCAAIQTKLETLEAQECGVILLLCTGEFKGLTCRKAWLVEPDQIVPQAAAALAGARRVGIVVPVQAQIESEARKWQTLQLPPVYAVASPYESNTAALARASQQLREQGADLIVLDCMGFVECHREIAARACGLPVVLSNALVAKLVAELF